MATTGKLTGGRKTGDALVTKHFCLKNEVKAHKKSGTKKESNEEIWNISLTQAQDRHTAASAALITPKHKLCSEQQWRD